MLLSEERDVTFGRERNYFWKREILLLEERDITFGRDVILEERDDILEERGFEGILIVRGGFDHLPRKGSLPKISVCP